VVEGELYFTPGPTSVHWDLTEGEKVEAMTCQQRKEVLREISIRRGRITDIENQKLRRARSRKLGVWKNQAAKK